MVYEVRHHFFLLALSNPENPAGGHVYDVGGVLVMVVELEFIYAQEDGMTLRLFEFSILRVEFQQATFVNGFNRVRAKARKL